MCEHSYFCMSNIYIYIYNFVQLFPDFNVKCDFFCGYMYIKLKLSLNK